MQNKDGLEIERRFLFSRPPDLTGMDDAPLHLEQAYLALPGAHPHETHRVRKSTDQTGRTTYFYTVKSPGKGAARNEREREIDEREFRDLLQHRDPDRRVVAKTRHAMPFAGHTLELDIFETELHGLVVLEIELSSFDAPLELPEWARDGVEITDEPWFSNFNLSHASLDEVWRRVREKLA